MIPLGVLPVLLLACADGDTGTPADGERSPSGRPNVVLFLSDDQRADTLDFMPTVRSQLIEKGIHFTRAYVSTALCCPTRASLLSGGWLAQHSGVRTSSELNGGFASFDDLDALPVRLQRNGYRTGMFGKYLNGYGGSDAYLPPGWDSVEISGPLHGSWSGAFVVRGSTGAEPAVGEQVAITDTYLTDQLTDSALDFVADDDGRPFFLYLAHYAPHYPATPAREDAGSFDGAAWRGGAWNEADVTDKPAHMQAFPPLTDEQIAAADVYYQHALESLGGLDRSVAALLDALLEAGTLDDTVFIYTSDNGIEFGEHRVVLKDLPYEESVRVPLIVTAPGLSPRIDDGLATVSTDIPATIAAIAGLPSTGDGTDLGPRLRDAAVLPPESLLIEGWRGAYQPTWAGIVTPHRKYVEYTTGEAELYDLDADPGEAESVHDDPAWAEERAELKADLETRKGLALVTDSVRGEVGQPLAVGLEAWGGVPPYRWSVMSGAPPAGLQLSHEGVLTGIPTTAGETTVVVIVDDSATETYSGAGQFDAQPIAFSIAP